MIKIICDSMSDLPLNILEKYDIDIIPLTVIFNGTEYLDGETLTKNEFYKMLRETNIMPKFLKLHMFNLNQYLKNMIIQIQKLYIYQVHRLPLVLIKVLH